MADRNVLEELSGLSTEEALEWIAANAESLTPGEVDQLEGIVAGGQHPSGEALAEAVSTLSGQAGDTEGALKKATERATQEVLRADTAKRPVDFGSLQDLAPSHMSRTQVAQFVRQASDAGREEADKIRLDQLVKEQGLTEEEAARQVELANTFGFSGTPEWILELSGAELSAGQKKRVVEYWNDLYGTRYVDFDTELMPKLGEPTSSNQYIVQSALEDVEPIMSFAVTIPGRDPVNISQADVETLKNEYGLSNDAISRIIRLSADVDQTDDQESPWLPIVALMAAHGMTGQLGETEQRLQEAEARSGDPLVSTFAPRPSGVSALLRGDTPMVKPGFPTGDPLASTFASAGNVISVAGLKMQYQEGLERYNSNETLAFLHAMDRGLAGRIAVSGGDPGKVSGADNRKALQYLQRGGIISRGTSPFEKLGGTRVDDHVLGSLQSYFDSLLTNEQRKALAEADNLSDLTGPGPRSRPDPVAVKEQVKQLWQGLFRAEPSDEIVSAFSRELDRMISGAAPEQQIDVTSRIQEWVRGQPIYKELYGKKPPGASEAEYQGQFTAAAQSLLGNELPDEESIVGGMRTGQYQTTIGSVAGSANAWQNSEFLRRMARAAQLVGEET